MKVAIKKLLRRMLGMHAQQLPAAQWGLERDAKSRMCLHGRPLTDIAAEHGTPLHVVDWQQLDTNLQALIGPGQLELFYSYKTNPVPGVLTYMHDRDVGAEVISGYEWWLARKLGVPGERIIYNGPAKDDASLIDAVAQGCLSININSINELKRISGFARQQGLVANIGLRLRVESGWTGQFGLSDAEWMEAVQLCAADPLLSLQSVHVHRGAAIRSAATATKFVQQAVAAWLQVCRAAHLEVPILNLGGSLACPTVDWITTLQNRASRSLLRPLPVPDSQACLTPGQYQDVVSSKIAESCAAASVAVPRVVCELGRGITANAQMLLASVLDRKPGDGDFDYLLLDAGINIAESMRNETHQIFHASSTQAPSQLLRLAGPICTPGDILNWACSLPPCEVGDVLAVMDSGAYFVPFSTAFSYPRPAVVACDGQGRVELLRQRETYDDMIGLDAQFSA